MKYWYNWFNIGGNTLAITLSNHQADIIANAFLKKFICIFGSPKGVLTDQGRDFSSNLLKRLAKKYFIPQLFTINPMNHSNDHIMF